MLKIVKQISKILNFKGATDIVSTQPNNIHQTCHLENVEIVGDVVLKEYVSITRGALLHGKIFIDKYTCLTGPYIDMFTLFSGIKIGKFCSIARHVSIQEGNHRSNNLSANFPQRFFDPEINRNNGFLSKGDIEIGNDVWIGAHAVIIGNVKIGDGAIIGANALVNKDVPPYAIVGGVPAKVIKYRFTDRIIELLNQVKWWDLDEEFLRQNLSFFNSEINEEIIYQFIEKINQFNQARKD